MLTVPIHTVFNMLNLCLDTDLASTCQVTIYTNVHLLVIKYNRPTLNTKFYPSFSVFIEENWASWLPFYYQSVLWTGLLYPPTGWRVAGWVGIRAGSWNFVECISLKLLDRFSPFRILWNCLDLKLCNAMAICSFVPYMSMPMGQKHGWIYSIQCFMKSSQPVAVQHHGHLPICLIWACS